MQVGRHEIVEVVSMAREREEPLVLSPQGKAVSFFCMALEVAEDAVVIRNPIPPHMAPGVLIAQAYGLFCRNYHIQSSALVPVGTHLRFPIPEFATLNKARNEERVYFAPKENAIVEIQHPFDPGTVLRRRVFDLSTGGMSFRARIDSPFIQPGRTLPSCRIFLQGLPYETRSGRVVYVKQIIDINSQSYFQVGVQFTEPDEEEQP